jgi:DNA-binding transcriptional ArsR family regulator
MNALDAIGNPVRRQILERLRAGPVAVGALAAGFPVSRPAISRHLRVLEDAGLVARRAVGRQNLVELRREGFEAAEAWLGSFWDDALTRFRLVAENLPVQED